MAKTSDFQFTNSTTGFVLSSKEHFYESCLFA